ncbi:MAG: protein translocase subunit SecDF [Bacteroidota bacterium]
MRNKSAVIFFTILISLLCLFYISFTFVSRNIESDAEQFATTKDGKVNKIKKQEYLDSLSEVPVYLGFNYEEVKEKEINLGLDLQGGMHITLEVSPVEIVRALAGNSKDPAFQAALQKAIEKQKTSQKPFADLFYNAFQETAPNTKLSRIFSNAANKDRINYGTTDAQVVKIIQEEIDGAMDRSFEILRNRIDKFGVTQPNIQKLPGTGWIQIELPGVDDPNRVRRLVQGVARLEFCEVWEPQQVFTTLQALNDYWVRKQAINQPKNANTSAATGLDALKAKTDSTLTDPNTVASTDTAKGKSALEKQLASKGDSTKKDSLSAKTSLLFSLLKADRYGSLAYEVQDTAKINRLLQDPEAKALIPAGMWFTWSAKPDVSPDGKTKSLSLFAIKRDRDGKAALAGDVISDASLDLQQGGAGVSMKMTSAGARKWKTLTAANIKKPIAIVLDNYVQSAPTVQNEIPNGSSSITGNFTVDEAKDLALKLKAGKMPAPTRIVEEAVVGASLGQDSIVQGLVSMVVGLGLIIVFMLIYYSSGGMVANLALLFNIFFIIGILAQFSAALTLPGMAGLVLTMGLSVDANVLIFERIREEIRNGQSMLSAIKLGYDRAYSSIIDSNVTTFLTAAMLYWFGSGEVKGFAVVLMIGIASSLFTAVFITRLIIEWMSRKGETKSLSFSNRWSNNLLNHFNFDFVKNRKYSYMFSAGVIVVGFILIAIQGGLNLGVDFQGGRSYVVRFDKPLAAHEVRSAVEDDFKKTGLEVKTFDSDNQLKITTSYLITQEDEAADQEVKKALTTGLSQFSALHPTIVSSSKVGSTIADDIKSSSQKAVFWTLLVIFLYILIRFGKWQYGLGAVVALFHDVLIVIAAYGYARVFGVSFEVDEVFVAAVLTVVGYSITDTVVVFDRIREFSGKSSHQELEQSLNQSINNTISRTVITAMTVIIVIVVLLIFGGDVLRGFSYAMLVGVIFGTYSSIFIAAPIVLDFTSVKLFKKETAAS